MKAIVYFLILFPSILFSQKLLQSNEECIFSFKTNGGKTVIIAKEKASKYLIYRYGKENNIELEFPEKNSQSWNKFSFNYYFRGGGKQNAGLDIDNLKFTNGGYTYTIFASYSAGDESNEESYTIGIVIYDKQGKKTRIDGIPKTEIGNLQEFRTNDLVKIDLESGLED